MAQHIIPQSETDLHTESQDCTCGPELAIDKETGEMVWMHELLNPEQLLKDFVRL